MRKFKIGDVVILDKYTSGNMRPYQGPITDFFSSGIEGNPGYVLEVPSKVALTKLTIEVTEDRLTLLTSVQHIIQDIET